MTKSKNKNNVGNKTKPTSKSLNLPFCLGRTRALIALIALHSALFLAKISFCLRANDGRANTQSILFIAHEMKSRRYIDKERRAEAKNSIGKI